MLLRNVRRPEQRTCIKSRLQDVSGYEFVTRKLSGAVDLLFDQKRKRMKRDWQRNQFAEQVAEKVSTGNMRHLMPDDTKESRFVSG